MDVVDTSCGYRERRLRRSIAEPEGVITGQQLHILGEGLPATGIVLCGSSAVRMHTPGLEADIWITADILLLLDAGSSIRDPEGVVGWE